MARWGGQRKKLADRARETENRDRRKSAEGLLLTGGNNVSDQNNHNSLYENSEYPSRRQAPRRSERSGRSRKKRRRGGVAGSIFKVLGTLLLSAAQSTSLAASLQFGAVSGLGFVVGAWALKAVYPKLTCDRVPASVRGYPAILLYIGILSMALYAANMK